MRIHLGIEDIEPDKWVAWTFEFPGCYSRGQTAQGALTDVPNCIQTHLQRLQELGLRSDPPASNASQFECELVERHKSFVGEDGAYYVNAFFNDDLRVLERDDVVSGKSLMLLNRIELINSIRPLGTAALDQKIAGDKFGSIREILRHVATAEWWYADRLDRAFDRSQWRSDVFELLQQTREHTSALLPQLVGETMVTEKRQERWSARKVLRRLLWHEHTHTRQIEKYLQQVTNSAAR